MEHCVWGALLGFLRLAYVEIARCRWVASGSGQRREHTWMRAHVCSHTHAYTCLCTLFGNTWPTCVCNYQRGIIERWAYCRLGASNSGGLKNYVLGQFPESILSFPLLLYAFYWLILGVQCCLSHPEVWPDLLNILIFFLFFCFNPYSGFPMTTFQTSSNLNLSLLPKNWTLILFLFVPLSKV